VASSGFDWKIDSGLSISKIEKAQGVVTACFRGVADSGTIVLHRSASEGRRLKRISHAVRRFLDIPEGSKR
jgi:L-lactate utilization protein LutC